MSPALADWRRQWHPTPVLLLGKSHGWRSLVGCSPWGREELDTTERLHFHFSLSCIGEGNGNPLQCSCLENPRDGEAWWAAVYGVAQNWTRLRRLSSNDRHRKVKHLNNVSQKRWLDGIPIARKGWTLHQKDRFGCSLLKSLLRHQTWYLNNRSIIRASLWKWKRRVKNLA